MYSLTYSFTLNVLESCVPTVHSFLFWSIATVFCHKNVIKFISQELLSFCSSFKNTYNKFHPFFFPHIGLYAAKIPLHTKLILVFRYMITIFSVLNSILNCFDLSQLKVYFQFLNVCGCLFFIIFVLTFPQVEKLNVTYILKVDTNFMVL